MKSLKAKKLLEIAISLINQEKFMHSGFEMSQFGVDWMLELTHHNHQISTRPIYFQILEKLKIYFWGFIFAIFLLKYNLSFRKSCDTPFRMLCRIFSLGREKLKFQKWYTKISCCVIAMVFLSAAHMQDSANGRQPQSFKENCKS